VEIGVSTVLEQVEICLADSDAKIKVTSSSISLKSFGFVVLSLKRVTLWETNG
jgi:hypothetical protein